MRCYLESSRIESYSDNSSGKCCDVLVASLTNLEMSENQPECIYVAKCAPISERSARQVIYKREKEQLPTLELQMPQQ